MDCSPSGSSVHEILQARILEWTAMLSSRGLTNPGTEPAVSALQADSLPPSHLGSLFSDINSSNIFSDQSPKKIKAKINKWDPIELLSFCTVNETVNKTK